MSICRRECTGDASEIALLKFTEFSCGDVMESRKKNKKLVEIPFNSTNKYQVSVHEMADQTGYLLVMKGAPEVIFTRCSKILLNGKEKELNEKLRKDFEETYLKLGGMGERVLGFCDLSLDKDKFPSGFEFKVENLNFPLKNLRFVGLISVSF